MVVVWSNSAKAELRKAFDYISLDSPRNAAMVRDALINMTLDLPENPEKHSLDKLKTNNDGTWRAFEKYHYRVSYHVLKKSNPHHTYATYEPVATYLLILRLLYYQEH